MTLTRAQLTMLRRIYRKSLAQQGMGNTVWVHEWDLHKSTARVLERLGLVQKRNASEITLPAHSNPPGYSRRYYVYILTQAGIQAVKDNTPILIGETVLLAGFNHLVVSWQDDYQVLELSNDGGQTSGIFCDPRQLRAIS